MDMDFDGDVATLDAEALQLHEVSTLAIKANPFVAESLFDQCAYEKCFNMKPKFSTEMTPYLAVILMQFGHAGTGILAKSALNQGLNHYAFSVYRNIVATVCFAPFAYFLERKIRPRMTLSVFSKIALLALLEPVLDQNLYYAGMKYTTATFAQAMCNILPAITFLLALTLRIEKVSVKRLHDNLKIIGTLITIGGAMIITLVRGPVIAFPWTEHTQHLQPNVGTDQEQPIKGALMITAGCLCWSLFFIVQVNVLKSYPAGLTITTLICMVGALQSTVLTLVVKRGDSTIWSLGWDAKLLACAYAGIVSSGIGYLVGGYVSDKKGPVFSTSFNPLAMVIVAILSSFVFHEQMNVGKVIGAAVIVVGLYLVIWSSRKNQKNSFYASSCPIDQQMSTSPTTKALTNERKIASQTVSGDTAV